MEAMCSEKRRLILENQSQANRLARSILNRWGAFVEDGELKSTVALALCEAASRFDETRGARFSTYLYYFLKGALAKEIKTRTSATEVEILEWQEEEFDNSLEKKILVKELRKRIREAITSLSELEQKVFVQVNLYDRKVTHVARQLGYSRGYLSEINSVAKEKLKQLMDERKLDS